MRHARDVRLWCVAMHVEVATGTVELPHECNGWDGFQRGDALDALGVWKHLVSILFPRPRPRYPSSLSAPSSTPPSSLSTHPSSLSTLSFSLSTLSSSLSTPPSSLFP